MSEPRATLAFLQAEFEAIYGVTAPQVGDYLLGREGARAAGAEPAGREALLVRQEEGGLALGLFLDEAVLRGAAAADPHHPRPQLTRRSCLDEVACAAEGVSHFVYLATRAVAGRPVSLLELEVQAEVDKFALLLLHLWRRGLRRASGALRRRLFERVGYQEGLGEEDLERYRTANRLGGGYARWLEGRFVEDADVEGLLRELRASYRLGGGEKLGHLAARAMN
ncbi:MAG TPA: hypothetical protein VFF02_10555 [Anaeromyxobacteraceae bacterium]|nr:hypothetical protein [Anaeromyxobacteraceae bacterium]